MKWYVVYKVEGFGEQKAGPYDLNEAAQQRNDIEGYEGVSDVHLVPETAVAR